MFSTRFARPLLAVAALVAASFVLVAPAPAARAQTGTVKVEWFGWSFFRFTSPTGKVVLTNPRITGNPDAAVSLDDVTQADLILVADGHSDEIGDTVAIAQKTGSKVMAPGGTNGWLIEQGIPLAQFPRRFTGTGTFYKLDGITVRAVTSEHGSELPQPTMTNTYGGQALGYYITFENGWTVYFTGSSGATLDQGMWASMYKPDALIFHMGGDHEPLDVAMTIKLTMNENPNLKTLMPHHHRVVQQPGQPTVADVQAALGTMGISLPITEQVRSQVYEFTK